MIWLTNKAKILSQDRKMLQSFIRVKDKLTSLAILTFLFLNFYIQIKPKQRQQWLLLYFSKFAKPSLKDKVET